MVINRRSVIMIAMIAGSVAACLAYQILLNRQTTSDNDQILDLLDTAQRAVERTDARGTMDVVSRDYKDSAGLTYPVLRLRVADALQSGIQPDVIIENPVVQVSGESAVVDLHVRVVDRSQSNDALINSDLTLQLQKQKLRKYLIFSAQQWRVVSVEGLGRIIETY